MPLIEEANQKQNWGKCQPYTKWIGGVSSVMLMVRGNRYSDPNSNLGLGCLHFT